MKRILLLLAVALVVLVPITAQAIYSPIPTSAVVNTRIFNDCPLSVLTVTNAYPALVQITDENPGVCFGYANLHNWRFSEDGINAAVFNNDALFQFGARLVISGTGEAEAGLQVAPWWSQNVDGRFNVRTTDGEIACFGGRLPFFSFTGTYGLHYVKGTPIDLEVVYHPNSLSSGDPATIEYKLVYNSIMYTSHALAFDEGNPAEDPPYGVWGMLNDGRAGGYIQYFLSATEPPHSITAAWSNIFFYPMNTPVQSSTWGGIKALYR